MFMVYMKKMKLSEIKKSTRNISLHGGLRILKTPEYNIGSLYDFNAET